MQRVTVKVAELLVKVRGNRANHRENFLRGLVGYKKTLLEELERRVEELRQGRLVSRSISIPEPMDHTHEYDRVIGMLEMSVDEEVHITDTEYSCFVMDEWGWREKFLDTVTAYHGLDAEAELRAIEEAKLRGEL